MPPASRPAENATTEGLPQELEDVEPSNSNAQDQYSSEAARLRCHLGMGQAPGMPSRGDPHLFFIELALYSSRGAKCKLAGCDETIGTGDYRVALDPGMNGHWSRSADYYHVECFEKIADLSDVDFIDRLQPVTRMTIRHRNVSAMSIIDGNYLLDGGAERLVSEWKYQRGKWIDARAGVQQPADDPAFHDLMQKAGSSSFTPQPVKDMPEIEYFMHLRTLAPIESDGPEDTDE